MKTIQYRYLISIFVILFLTGCSSPKDQFIEAAVKEGTVTDRKILACVADDLQKELSEDKFNLLIEQLKKISNKELAKEDASMSLLGAMTVAAGACKVNDMLGGLGDDKKEEQ